MLKNRRVKKSILIIIDFIIVLLAYFISVTFRFKFDDVSIASIVEIFTSYMPAVIFFALIYVITFGLYRQYNSIWTIAGFEEFLFGVIATGTSSILIVILSIIFKIKVPLMVTIMAGVVVMLLCNGIRVSWRIIRRMIIYSEAKIHIDYKKVLVVGAGAAGVLITNELKKNPKSKKKVVAFVDDNIQKKGKYISGVEVIGNREDIERVVSEKGINEIIIAISELKESNLKQLIHICKNTGCQVKIMPGVSEMIDGKFTINKIRDVKVEDLLGRDSIKLDHRGILEYIEGKVIMVTGGGGSIGSELCRQIIGFNPKQLIIVDIYENNAYDLQNELLRRYPKLNLKTLIASVRDKDRMRDIYINYRPEVVFHAAAHKHVPLMEESPGEAIKNNVVGTLNVAELASEYEVERFVLISTDKAVNPTNVMGASKRLCEMIVQAINRESSTEYVAVRFGNVLGSNGSVVPLFKRQIAEGGPITLTHKDITRYFMTIPEASQLVLQAGGYAKGGEIFVLDMGEPVRIYDLAENLIRLSGYTPGKDIKINITGLRPGEKLYEELLMDEEGLMNTSHEMIFIGKSGKFVFNDIKEDINKLLNVAESNNTGLLRRKLKEIVPTYSYCFIEEVAITK